MLPYTWVLYSAAAALAALPPNITSGGTLSNSDSTTSGIVLENPNLSADLACLRSWSAYESSSQAAYTSLISPCWLETSTIPLGTADIFRTTDGIPVAKGRFRKTRLTSTNYWTSGYREPTDGFSLPISTPSCGYNNKVCDNYLSDLGFRRNGTAVITPTASFDSVACPIPSTSCASYTYREAVR